MQKKQFGRFGIFHLLLILIFAVPISMFVQRHLKEKAAHEAEAEKIRLLEKTGKELAAILDVDEEYSGAFKLAASTSKIAVATPVQRLQDIHLRLSKMEASGCAAFSKALLERQMGFVEDGFIEFMRGEGDAGQAGAAVMFKLASEKKDAFRLSVIECQKETAGKASTPPQSS